MEGIKYKGVRAEMQRTNKENDCFREKEKKSEDRESWG